MCAECMTCSFFSMYLQSPHKKPTQRKKNCTHGHGVDTEIYGDFINSHHIQQKGVESAILDEYFIIVN